MANDCLGIATTDSKGTVRTGTCLMTDADGDKWRFNYKAEDTPSAPATSGTLEMTGLNGKYTGASGTCSFENKRIIVNGVILVSSLGKCSVSR